MAPPISSDDFRCSQRQANTITGASPKWSVKCCIVAAMRPLGESGRVPEPAS